MSQFSATTASEAVVPAGRTEIWAVLTDPVLLPKLTPLLRRIETRGDLWRWYMIGINVMGVGISPCFTERMRFDQERRIDYSHEPPKGTVERTGAEGWYELSDAPGGTRLTISLTLCVDLPLPRVMAPAVTRVIKGTMERTGDRFSANLMRHLGVEGQARAA